MKKLLMGIFILSSMAAMADDHIYGKLSMDLHSSYSKISQEGTTIFDKDKGRGWGIFLERTRDLTDSLEVGAGIGYIRRQNGDRQHYGEYAWDTPRYHSVPIYALAKKNFAIDEMTTAYLKADFGFAYNTAKTRCADIEANGKYENCYNLEAKNGIYTGLAAGVEYQNFLAELSYHITTSKLSIHDDDGNISGRKTYNAHNVSLAIGYKFNF